MTTTKGTGLIQPNRKRRNARLLGAVSVAAMAFALLPISPAAAAIDANDACANSPEDGFTDTGLEDADDLPNDVEDAVDCLSACDITVGQFGSVLYGTGNLVTRGQLASFVMNVLDRVDGFQRPGNPVDEFEDDEGSVHERNINDAAALGIIRGFQDGTYRPTAPVSRAQMATFLVNTLEEAGVAVPGTTMDAFTDDESSVHEDNINRLAALDVVDGEAPGIYNPERSVTRGTMAFFLTRTYELIVEEGLADPCGGNETLAISPQGDATLVCTDPAIETTTTTDQRTYTVSGLDSAADFRITLVTSENVTTDAEGNTVFEADPADPTLALAGTVAARIVTVNGANAATPAQTFGAVVPVNGTITFVVDCGGAESVTPVIYEDQGASTRLELDANGLPVEDFGTGGTITFTGVVVDTTPPTATVTSPLAGATGVVATANLTATFDEDLAATSAATLTCGSAGVAGAATVVGSTITFNPTTDLAASATCTVTFTATDAAGNTSTTTVSFTVAGPTGDTTPPAAVDADFVDAGTDGVFGGGTENDVITFALDEVVPTEAGDTFTIDGVVLTCNVNVGCTPNTLTSRIGLTSGVLTPAITITLGTSAIEATSVDDAAGNDVTGLPTVIDIGA